MTYLWDFGDATTSTLTSPTHTYSGTGPYTIKLTATSSNGCTHDTSKQLATIFARPTAVFTSPASVCKGDSIQLSEQSTAPGSSVTQWFWSFGDGNTSALQNPKYAWANPGTYTIKLWVNSASGCRSDTMSKQIQVSPAPIAGFTTSAVRCAGKDVTFTDASNPGVGSISEWHWTFGDGGLLDQTTAGPVMHTYVNAGTYTVTLSVKNTTGCSGTTFTSQVVVNANPVANFTSSSVCVPTGLAQFTDQSTPAGTITGWSWDFGDATAISTQSSPTHTYTNGAAYTVKLSVTASTGCTKDTSKVVLVYNTPVTKFGIANASGLCSNTPVTLTDSSAVTGFGSVTKLEIIWDNANNPTTIVTVNSPAANATYTHQYANFGTPLSKVFRVVVRSYSGSGCVNETFKDITVKASPLAVWTGFNPVCQDAAPFILTGGSDFFNLPGTGTYSGPGVNTASPQMFSPLSAGAGIHTIRYSYNANGCTSFKDTTVQVYALPSINAGADRFVIEGDDILINTTGSGAVRWLWTPSTFLVSDTVESALSRHPTSDMLYTVTATSDKGCMTSDQVFVKLVKDFKVPNTFTPNGDGVNDKWLIENLSLYPMHRIQVFNRYGQVVYESKDYTNAWNGTYKGKDLPAGTYYYVIELGPTKKPKVGYVTMIK